MASIKIDVTVNKGRVVGISQGIRGLQGADTLESAINADRAEAARIGAEAAETVAVSSKDITVSNAAITNSDVVTTNADALQTGLDRIATAADVVTISNAETNTSADAVQTALDRVATGADVVTTNADAISTSADATQTALDRIATGEDRTATNQDATNTALDLVATNQDTIDTAADRVQTTADAASANTSKLAAAASASDSADSAALAATYAAATTHGLVMMGQWDASGGTAPPTPPNDPNDAAHNYIISVAGTILTTDYEVDDEIIWDSVNNVWFKRDNTERMKSVNGMTGNVNVTPTTIGLDQIDNTSDINKPISSATQTALDNKANTSGTYAGLRAQATTKDDVGLGNVDNTSDLNKPISTATQAAIDGIDNTSLDGKPANYYANIAHTVTNPDPNTAQYPVIETGHANVPTGVGRWLITTTFKSTTEIDDDRTQIAVLISDTESIAYVRSNNNGGTGNWSAWEPMTGEYSLNPNTLVKRDGAGKLSGSGIALTSVEINNSDIDGILTRKSDASGGVHGSTLAQVKSALNGEATNWVLKWSGSSTLIGNSWGEGLYLIKVGTDAHVVVECVSGKYCKSPDFAYNGKLTQVTAYIGAFSGYARNAGTTNGAAANIYSIWKAE